MADTPGALQLRSTYLHLGGTHEVTPLPVTDSFWPDLMGGAFDHLGAGRLVTLIDFARDWDTWEMHPNGEEVVCLVSGEVDAVLETADGERALPLRGAGAFVVIPRGTWHTLRVRTAGAGLFITAGEGTEHRPA